MKDLDLMRLRDRELYYSYCRTLEEYEFGSAREAVDFARQRPAPQFFITARNASLGIGKIIAGIRLDCNDNNRRKYEELHRRYVAYLKEHPGTILSRERICEDLVDEPAPEFYVGVEMAMRIVRSEREKIINEMARRYKR